MSELSTYLKIARENVKLTQTEVGKRLGYQTAQYISNWEQGASEPPIGKLKKLAKLYAIDSNDILNYILNRKLKLLEAKVRKQYEESKG